MQTDVQELLIKLLCSELTEQPLDASIKAQLTPQRLSDLYHLSKIHDLSHIVASALETLELLGTDELSRTIQRKEIVSVYRCERFKYELAQVSALLRERNIPFIPLKGSVIRSYYPKESMRTSCDIDILVPEKDAMRVADLLVDCLEYRKESVDMHDIQMYAPNGVHLELHFALIETYPVIDRILSEIWDHVSVVDGSHMQMHDDYFLFYYLAHMGKHFVRGGCGLRSFMDLWVIEHCMKIDRHAADSLLSEASLLDFSEAMFSLSDVLFSGAEHTALTRSLQEYVVNAGIYGTRQSTLMIKQAKTGGKSKYIFNKIFLSYTEMKNYYYPSVKKYPVLFPFYQVRRWCKIIFCGEMKRSLSHLRDSRAIPSDKLKKASYLCEQLKLRDAFRILNQQ